MAETPIRPVRVPDDIWTAAVAKAKKEGTSASAIVVAALKHYVRQPTPTRTADHVFAPQKRNALRCETCGLKKSEHQPERKQL